MVCRRRGRGAVGNEEYHLQLQRWALTVGAGKYLP